MKRTPPAMATLFFCSWLSDRQVVHFMPTAATSRPMPHRKAAMIMRARAPWTSPEREQSHITLHHHITSHHIPSHPTGLHRIPSHPIHHISSLHITSLFVPSHSITSHRIASYCITSHHIISWHTPSHPIASYRIPSHNITSHPIASHPIISHCIVSHRITLHRITFHRIPSSYRIPSADSSTVQACSIKPDWKQHSIEIRSVHFDFTVTLIKWVPDHVTIFSLFNW